MTSEALDRLPLWDLPGLKLNMQKTKIMASSPITSWQIDGGNSDKLHFLGFQNQCVVTAATKVKDACSLEEEL